MTVFGAIAFFAAAALFCLAQGIFWILRSARREKEAALLRRLKVGEEQEDIRITRAMHGELTGVLAEMESMRKLNMTLLQAGIGLPLRAFLLLSATIAVGVFVLLALVTGSMIGSFLLGIITAIGIHFYTVMRRDRRLGAIENQLPKALELMMIGLRAGHTLEDTIRYAAEELDAPLSSELGRCYEEYDLGRPIEQALTNLAVRLAPCKSLRTFVESVLVLKQTGGNLVEIIEQIIDSLRSQAAFEARYRALTSEGRTSGLILSALPLLVLSVVLLLQPGYVGVLLTNSTGQTILALGTGLWLLGMLWLFSLVKPTV